LPVSPLSRAFAKQEFVECIEEGGDVFVFVVANSRPDAKEYAPFHYLFSRDFRILEVKSSHNAITTHEKLVQEGKISGSIDASYLKRLKGGVRYWDGVGWRSEPVKVLRGSLTVK
jgi:hypothetical protein